MPFVKCRPAPRPPPLLPKPARNALPAVCAASALIPLHLPHSRGVARPLGPCISLWRMERFPSTTAVNGHVTGLKFEGEGEVLLTPPNQVERVRWRFLRAWRSWKNAFATSYLRFTTDFQELQP